MAGCLSVTLNLLVLPTFPPPLTIALAARSLSPHATLTLSWAKTKTPEGCLPDC